MATKLKRDQVEEILEGAKKQGTKPDFREVDLTGIDLSSIDLAGINFSQANLHRANLSHTNMRQANLTGAILFNANLGWADLSQANLSEAKLGWADLNAANLTQANLSWADLSGASLFDANLTGADLSSADLLLANLNDANLNGAILTEAKLTGAMLINTNFTNAVLNGCAVYGISAWDLNLAGAQQLDLDISRWNEPAITVDNLEVAQFIHLLLHNEQVQRVIQSITAQVVLILGQFSATHKLFLDALRSDLRRHDYLPIVVDFEKPSSDDQTMTVLTLARMASFVIADVSSSVRVVRELERIVPDPAHVPLQILQVVSEQEQRPLDQLTRYPWVLEIYRYNDLDHLVANLRHKVITPAENALKQRNLAHER